MLTMNELCIMSFLWGISTWYANVMGAHLNLNANTLRLGSSTEREDENQRYSMSKDMMEVIHQAIDELQIGLDKLDDKQVKETYNALVALQIELHRKYTSHYTKRLGLYGSKR